MSKINETYSYLLGHILREGYKYPDPKRTGVERLEISSYTFKHEFKDGFPAISTKKLQYKQVVTELIWFLKGDTNIKYLVDNDCNIWNKDAYNYYIKKGGNFSAMMFRSLLAQKKGNFDSGIRGYQYGDLGPVYGHQWRNFNGVDQIQRLIKNLKEQPMATDHIVNSWNAGDLKDMALPPCHYGFQVIVKPLEIKERLLLSTATNLLATEPLQLHINNLEYHNYCDKLGITKYGFELHWQQRSVDTFLGLPYNIASYATLALFIESLTGYKALAIQGDLKKVHLYDNSIDAVKEQLSRDTNKYIAPTLQIKPFDMFNMTISLDEIIDILTVDNFELHNYESDPGIRVEMLERDE